METNLRLEIRGLNSFRCWGVRVVAVAVASSQAL